MNTYYERLKLGLTPPKGWIPGFSWTLSLFIHIPKAAGTSISHILYDKDPGHFPISHYQFVSKKLMQRLFKFAIVRDPVDRLLSTYNYSFEQIKSHPNTSVAFVTRYPSFIDFVDDWVNSENVNKHYFFKPQTDYLFDDNGQLGVDFVGYFENLGEEFNVITKRLRHRKVTLPSKNQSPKRATKKELPKATIMKIQDVYAQDYQHFNF